MANTQFIKDEVEPWVRKRLEENFGQPFRSDVLKLRTGRNHEFDAVSADGAMIFSIKSASGRTATGGLPQGKFHTAIAELYFLSLVSGQKRVLLVTNPQFYKLLERRLAGLMPDGVHLECLPLPHEMQAQLDAVIAVASKEVSPAVASAAVEDEIEH